MVLSGRRRRQEEHEALLQKFRDLKGQQKFARIGDTCLLAVNEPLLEL